MAELIPNRNIICINIGGIFVHIKITRLSQNFKLNPYVEQRKHIQKISLNFKIKKQKNGKIYVNKIDSCNMIKTS